MRAVSVYSFLAACFLPAGHNAAEEALPASRLLDQNSTISRRLPPPKSSPNDWSQNRHERVNDGKAVANDQNIRRLRSVRTAQKDNHNHGPESGHRHNANVQRLAAV